MEIYLRPNDVGWYSYALVSSDNNFLTAKVIKGCCLENSGLIYYSDNDKIDCKINYRLRKVCT